MRNAERKDGNLLEWGRWNAECGKKGWEFGIIGMGKSECGMRKEKKKTEDGNGEVGMRNAERKDGNLLECGRWNAERKKEVR
jgi:hypothetical protein